MRGPISAGVLHAKAHDDALVQHGAEELHGGILLSLSASPKNPEDAPAPFAKGAEPSARVL